MATLYLCGAGNSEGVRLALRINEEQARWDRIVLLDDDPAKRDQSKLGVEIAGPFAMLAEVEPESAEVANLVARTTKKRWAAHGNIQTYGLPCATLISPDVDLAGVDLGTDIIVYRNATLGPEVSVGDTSVIFMGAVVGHESRMGRCSVVAANAVLNARVHLGDGVYVGTNATVLPEVTVGPWATIGAGSVVVQDVPAGATVMGVPAELLITQEEQTEGDARPSPAAASTAPRSEVTATLTRIWSDVLGHLE